MDYIIWCSLKFLSCIIFISISLNALLLEYNYKTFLLLIYHCLLYDFFLLYHFTKVNKRMPIPKTFNTLSYLLYRLE